MSSYPIARLNLCCNFAKIKYPFCIARYMAQIKRLFMILLMFKKMFESSTYLRVKSWKLDNFNFRTIADLYPQHSSRALTGGSRPSSAPYRAVKQPWLG